MGALAAPDAGRSDVILDSRQEEVPDCPWAVDRDCLTAMTVMEHLVLRASRAGKELRRSQQPQDASQKVACRLAPLVSQVL